MNSKRNPWLGFILYLLVTGLPRLFNLIGWWKWRIEGRENLLPRKTGGMIIVTNHVDWIDIIALASIVPISHRLSWFGKAELFESKLGNWFFREVDVVPVKRGRGDLEAMKKAANMLKSGAVFAFFPEGHRSETGELQQGQGGAIRLAMQSGVPIVPGALIGTQDGLKKSFRRQEITLRLGKPYTLEPTPNGKIPPPLMKELVTDMMQRIAELLPEEHHGFYRRELTE